MVLIDTSSWIHFLRKNGEVAVKERVRRLLESGDAVVCPVIMIELWMGAGSERDRQAITKIEHIVFSLEINRDVWVRATRLSQLCRSHGTPVPASDVMIAACAFTHGSEIEAVDSHYQALAAYRKHSEESL